MAEPGGIWRSLMRGAVRTYPRAWRRRYDVEMLALIDDMPAGPRPFANLVRASGREWARTLGRSGPRHLAGLSAGILEDAGVIALQAVLLAGCLAGVLAVLFPADGGELSIFGAVPLNPGTGIQFVSLALRIAVLMRIVVAALTWAYRRGGAEPQRSSWWFGSVLLSFFVANSVQEILAIRLRVWPRMSELEILFGQVPTFIWAAAISLAADGSTGRDVLRLLRRSLTPLTRQRSRS
jgi:hypothetical protein